MFTYQCERCNRYFDECTKVAKLDEKVLCPICRKRVIKSRLDSVKIRKGESNVE